MGRQSSGEVVGVIPLNRLDRAKSRLRGALAPDQRAALTLWLAERTLTALRDSGQMGRLVVVSPDPGALAWAAAHGATPLAQPSLGLNAGLALARGWALEQNAAALLIALGDLPLLTPLDVRRFVTLSQLGERVVALAPDQAREGTNLMLARPPALAPLAYGRGSFARHRQLAHRQGAATLEFHAAGAAFDVDTVRDLNTLLAQGLWRPATPDGEPDHLGAPTREEQPHGY